MGDMGWLEEDGRREGEGGLMGDRLAE